MQSNFWADSNNLDQHKKFATCKRTRHKFCDNDTKFKISFVIYTSELLLGFQVRGGWVRGLMLKDCLFLFLFSFLNL